MKDNGCEGEETVESGPLCANGLFRVDCDGRGLELRGMGLAAGRVRGGKGQGTNFTVGSIGGWIGSHCCGLPREDLMG